MRTISHSISLRLKRRVHVLTILLLYRLTDGSKCFSTNRHHRNLQHEQVHRHHRNLQEKWYCLVFKEKSKNSGQQSPTESSEEAVLWETFYGFFLRMRSKAMNCSCGGNMINHALISALTRSVHPNSNLSRYAEAYLYPTDIESH